MSAIRDGGTDIISYKWLGVGKPVDINYNVPATHLSYGTAADHYAGLDRFGRPISVPWLKDGSPALVHTQYRYDRSSIRQWRRDAAAHAAGVVTEDQWYEYDGLYQVGEFQRGTLSGSYPNFSGIIPVAQNQDWNYDAMGNWLGFQSDALNQTRQFNKVNEITSINGPSGVVTPQYDPVGNMTSMPAVSNWTTAQTLKWDAWNRLVRVTEGSTTIAEYSYDALFRRVTKTVSGTTRRFYYSDQWQILEEYLGSAVNPEMRYWYGLRDINDIARRQRYSSGTTLQDDLYALRETMNVVGLADTSGAVQQRMVYDAFGAVRFLTSVFAAGSNGDGWNFLFHGHYRDAETGLYQMRYRYYHQNLGVWLSREPLGEGPSGLYVIAINNCINFLDRKGLSPEPIDLWSLGGFKGFTEWLVGGPLSRYVTFASFDRSGDFRRDMIAKAEMEIGIKAKVYCDFLREKVGCVGQASDEFVHTSAVEVHKSSLLWVSLFNMFIDARVEVLYGTFGEISSCPVCCWGYLYKMKAYDTSNFNKGETFPMFGFRWEDDWILAFKENSPIFGWDYYIYATEEGQIEMKCHNYR